MVFCDREPLTLFKFWLISNETTEESPGDITRPTDDVINSELSNRGLRTALYESSEWYDVADSFGVYVDGKVFAADLPKFQSGLNAYWNDTGTGCWVKFLFPEMYFKPTQKA